jgi:hypothetical protein
MALGQNITGTVKDEEGGLLGATAMLLNAKDSVLSSFAIADAQGNFVIKKAFNGEYILQINFIGYKTLTQKLTVSGQDIDLGELKLETDIMNELVVEGDRVPIEMKKDTIEYNAAAFKTQPNAVVEDLLKKLPGVEVDRDGTIKAQGETVNKVLVDGKEFFGNDPQMATKNLAADAVSKVQVFDRKSEFSQFSGIDDGNQEKTINLTLKDDKKQGTFGKVGAGGGTSETYQLDANVNQFRKDNQFSVIAKHNNINEQGFAISDYISFMGGMSNLGGGRGGGFQINSAIPLGNDVSNGFVTTTVGGLNFNRDFSEKSELQSNYLFSRIQNIQRVETRTSDFRTSNPRETDQVSNNESLANMHQLSLNYKHQFSKAADIQIRNTLSYNDATSDGSGTSEIQSPISRTSGTSQNLSDATALNLNSRLIFRQRFNKPGRTLVTEANITRNQDDTNGQITNETFDDTETRIGLVDQDLNNAGLTTTLGAEVAFTEPIGQNTYFEARYEHETTTDEDDRKVYDLTSGSAVLDIQLSQLYTRTLGANRFGGSYNYVKDKFRFTAGALYQVSDLSGEVAGDNPLERSFDAPLPFVRSNYDFTNAIRMSFNYNTSLRIPTIRELQPVLDNSNQFNLYRGNPDLDAPYVHTTRLNFNWFDQFTSKSFFTFLSASFTQNNIVTERIFDDATNVQTSSPVNSGNAITLTNYASFSGRIRFAKMRYNLSNRISRNTGNAINNGTVFGTRTLNNTLSFSVENAKKEKIDWLVGTRLTNNATKSDDVDAVNQNLTNTSYYSDVTWYFVKKWSLTSLFDLTVYSNDGIATGNQVALWRASIQRDFLKNDRGQFKLSVFDLLNQNVGVNQTTNLNYIQEQQIQSLGRYFMFSLTYKLSNYQSNGGIQFRGTRG